MLCLGNWLHAPLRKKCGEVLAFKNSSNSPSSIASLAIHVQENKDNYDLSCIADYSIQAVKNKLSKSEHDLFKTSIFRPEKGFQSFPFLDIRSSWQVTHLPPDTGARQKGPNA